MDTVIFSGRVSKSEMLHERRRWYDRLVATGRLEEFRVKDEWERWKGIARCFGYIFFGLGVLLLLLIVYAMTSRLTHTSDAPRTATRPAVVQPASLSVTATLF